VRELDLETLPPAASSATPPTVIDVVYDGADLTGVAQHLGRSVDALIDWHTRTPWNVEFLGFMPGFGYLTREDHTVPIERHRSPRRAIPAGSVGFAGGYCGIYPVSSPGGWQLVGHTDAVLFDATGDGALLAAGGIVGFRAVR
jgi:KipI family sensor histidine kinase inhibitor